MRLSTSCCGPYLLLFLLFFSVLFGSTFGHPDHVDLTDEEIDAMDIDFLGHVEEDLRSQNGLVDKHIASLNGKLTKLKRQEDLLERTQKRVEHAKDWESRQKRQREQELARARAEFETKKQQAATLEIETNRLREKIQELQKALEILNEDKTKLDNEEKDPSLDAILFYKATRMGSVPQHIFNKTMELISPELEYGLHEIFAAQELFPKDSTMMTLLTSFCIYVLALSVLYITFTVLKNLNTLFTLPRILFTVDMAFALTWIFACFFFMVLSDDPFGLMSKRHGGLTVIVQMVLLGALVGNVILRCIPISLHPGKMFLFELSCVVFVTQHYYQYVWRPCLLDEELSTGPGTYFVYLIISSSLAVCRARSAGRGIEDLEGLCVGGSLSFLRKGSWFRMKIERTLGYCEDLLRASPKPSEVKFRVEPQYYRKSRHPEFSAGKRKYFDGRSSLRFGKKAIA